ncbi:hypothetical protein FJ960_02135 [Mesorhizobium sp. B2-3-11]|uniref:hypothetical protein n=1 Tax=Mesorhizobium sp. B2-3-11 TaxID=2589953 RepID=UPI0011276436|nr:hypothetical protein [Mesorhizobium sp. B2-3-11]TPM11564.1 hypothetical protein FJ960_02135 [Mesorhizobium sp. B2-3-11]
MFGFFDSDITRVRKLRLEFEDIRQRVLYKMNPYKQYSFISGYRGWVEQFREALDQISETAFQDWRQTGDVLRKGAQRSWNEARRMPGIAGEGAIAGAEALAMLALLCSAKGYGIAEALTLKSDVAAFEAHVDKLVANLSQISN